MRTWLRRTLYLIIVIVWLSIMLIPVAAVVLASRGQIQLGDQPTNQTRIFLLQERNQEGLGLQWTRPVSTAPLCAETRIGYLMWAGEGENVRYCQCFDENGGLQSSAPGACPD